MSAYEQLDPTRKVVIFDDSIEVRLQHYGGAPSLGELNGLFGRVVLLANDLTIDVGDLLDPQENHIPRLCIQPFGFVHRNELIEKWLAKSSDADEEVLARRAVEITRTMDQVISRGYVPAIPVYVLAILQAFEASITVDTKISTHGYYYELLIRSELLRGASNKETDVLTGFLSFLAYAVFTDEATEISIARSDEIQRDYQKRYDVH